ncbi:Dipeptidyl-peptidase III [Purpureocillium takamizusanense]|uniref:Dipeptidyl peptidase 3 n=1 Tax=Purpureocillium takamizusanense TaxID=2060973 RepID=A0A9Q8QH40_9HYPO|nr:Dipeptidyl-peptidase III [Purpureocillium takamizusanense]UNI18779.1 Dipeptidyl-peptidase III [Purpureocillium takamizusanense]
MAVHEVQIFQMGIGAQFERLTYREKRYAHHLARSAWLGARIVLEQVSPESRPIFDFILELYRDCSGDWHSLVGPDVSSDSLHAVLTYAATFLSNIGNYYGSGDQKFTPGADDAVFRALARRSPTLSDLYDNIAKPIKAIPPFSLGYPSDDTQSNYYPSGNVEKEEITAISKVLEENGIFPENTRIRKRGDHKGFDVLLASVKGGDFAHFPLPDDNGSVRLVGGDYSTDLERVCAELTEASKWAANDTQRDFLKLYVESFQTGSLDAYREAQRIWVRDKAPRVENIFGFVEPYRDPHGVRAEFEGLVAIADHEETKLLAKLVQHSDTFIRRLPWATPENNGKGPFEKDLFEPPDFSSIHALAYCSSIIFPGINLPNYNDIRQDDGFKNVIISNRMVAESQAQQYPFIDASELDRFKAHKSSAYYWWVVLHELLGHGTGRMMVETGNGKFNFDIENLPVNPITGKPISSWYKPDQTWTGLFGDLATTVDECRAELVGAYLMDDPELLGLFGFNEDSDIRAEDLTYNLYQQLGVDGLRGLSNFNVQSGKWGQAHSRAHFAILKWLLLHGDGVIVIIHDKPEQRLTVNVQHSKIRTHGKPALGRMLLQLHMFRCTADAEGCRMFYEDLSKVDTEYMEWRETVLANKPPPMIFVHANTFLDGEKVTLKEYEPTLEGILTSWAERRV